jgi:ABC-2 type transport system permease protein
MKSKFYTIYAFTKINTKRYFRDKTAIFFTIAFPLIFLFVFGGLFGGNNDLSFKVVVINQSSSEFSNQFVDEAKKGDILELSDDAPTLEAAREKMNRGELDAAIVLPQEFGAIEQGSDYPSGQAKVYYTQNNQQAAQTLASLLEVQFSTINSQFVKTETPFTVATEQTGDQGLRQFDYTFAGLLGFSIIGLGIFGPVNVFPELKKQGVLRRFHTTPLSVWQYFLANMATQAIIGLFAMAIFFAVAIGIFHLNVVGNPLELTIFLVLSIITILGIGLALGGWAKNERQVAPLANIVVFPMMFLSGTFFPRFLMPEWLQNVSAFLPLTPVIDGLRLITTEGKGLLDLLPQLGMIGGWAIVIYVIAFRVFRWE